MKTKRWIAFALTAALSLGPVFTVTATANETDDMKDPERSAFPSSYSLVDAGLVTPVKDQEPFGTCWAFGSISALETAVLHELGMTYEEALASDKAITPLLDLSEKHLAWFTYQGLPASVNPTQAGEGMIVKNQELNTSEVYDQIFYLYNCFSCQLRRAGNRRGHTLSGKKRSSQMGIYGGA